LKTAAAAAGFAAVVLAVALDAYRERVWNLDCVAYIAATLSSEHEDPVALHRAVYEDLEAGVPRAAFKEITGSSGYRKALRRDPAALATQLRFYINRRAGRA
jgi:hypothetical protein